MENKTPETEPAPEKKTLGRALLNLWYGFLRFFGLMTIHHHDEACSTLRVIYEGEIRQYEEIGNDLRRLAARYKETIAKHEETIANGEKRITDLEHEILAMGIKEAELVRKTDELSDTNKDLAKEKVALKKKLDEEVILTQRYKDTALDNRRYVKDAMATNWALTDKIPEFGFYRASPIPGSTAVASAPVVDEHTGVNYTEVNGRVIALDQTTAQMNREPDMYAKIQLMINQMASTGTLSKMVERLILGGAVGMELVYNRDNTNYTLLWSVRAVVPKTQYTFNEIGSLGGDSGEEEPASDADTQANDPGAKSDGSDGAEER